MLLLPTLATAGVNQVRKAEVKSLQVAVTLTPTLQLTQTPTPTTPPSPTETPVPTLTPTNTSYPTRVYISPTQAPAAVQSESLLDNNNYYTNSTVNTAHSLVNTIDGSVPAGATARCGDGTYSFSQSRQGTCSHHGGVATWL